MILRVWGIIFAVLFCLNIFCLPTGATENEQIANFLLNGYELENGEVEIAILLNSPHGICGALLELNYDPSEFLLLAVGATESGLDHSYRERDGSVRILFDGVRNTDNQCELARLYFKRVNGSFGGANFSLGENLIAFSLINGEFSRETVTAASRDYFVGGAEHEWGGEVELISASASVGDDGRVSLGLTMDYSGEAFAVGAEMFFIDFGNAGECDRLFVSSVILSREKSELCIDVGSMESFCVVVTPILYVGRKTRFGEGRVAIVNVRHGEIYVILS